MELAAVAQPKTSPKHLLGAIVDGDLGAISKWMESLKVCAGLIHAMHAGAYAVHAIEHWQQAGGKITMSIDPVCSFLLPLLLFSICNIIF